jgi:DNA-binding beta-propeller fold protein YncE
MRLFSLSFLAFVAAFLFPVFQSDGQSQAPLKMVQELQFPASVKGRLDHLGIDLDGGRLFAVAEEARQVLVFDLKTAKLVHQIAVDHPHAVLYRADVHRIYITDEGKGVLDIYDGTNYELLKTVALKVDADSIGYDPATHYLYIVNGGDNAHETFTMLSVVDTTSEQKLADIKIDGDTLEAMALETSGDRLFLDNPAKNEVEAINRKTKEVMASWPLKLGKGNSTMALDDASHRLFVGCRSGQIVVFDTTTGKELQALPIGPRADDLMFDSASKRIYATSGGAGEVNVYQETDPNHYQSLGKLRTGPGAKTGLFVPHLGRLYVGVPPQGAVAGKVSVYTAQ